MGEAEAENDLWVIKRNAVKEMINIARIANVAQCHSLLTGHYDCHDLRFSIV